MNDDQIIALAVEKGLIKDGVNFFPDSIRPYAFDELIAFARAIADMQKEQDAKLEDRIANLSDDERMSLFSQYCKYCKWQRPALPVLE